MIDFAKRLLVFAAEGFVMGYYISSNEHLEFKLVHNDERLRINITVCLHNEAMTKYAFQLWLDGEVAYEGRVESEGDMMLVSGVICNKVRLYKGAEA